MDMLGNSDSWGDIVGRDFQAFLSHFQMFSRLYSSAKLSLSSNSISLQKNVSDRGIFTWLQMTTFSFKGWFSEGEGYFLIRVTEMESITDHKIDYNRAKALRGQWHLTSKN